MRRDYFLFGLQRTGTNYLQQLIKTNFDLENNPQVPWKHSIDIPDQFSLEAQRPILVIVKNPYTWVESISFRHKVDFVERQKKFNIRAGSKEYQVGPYGLNIIGLAQTYKEFCKNWCTKGLYIIRYEQLLHDDLREKVLDDFSIMSGTPRPEVYENVPVGRVSQSPRFTVQDIEYYKECKPTQLTKKQINHINTTIGKKWIQGLGYKVI